MPFQPTPSPEGTLRDDMVPVEALYECWDLWGAGAWDDRNAEYNLAEVMEHLTRLFESLGIVQ